MRVVGYSPVLVVQVPTRLVGDEELGAVGVFTCGRNSHTLQKMTLFHILHAHKYTIQVVNIWELLMLLPAAQ
jgi:hypothetical protein